MIAYHNLYLALGDSITAGYGVGRESSFAAIYAGFLRSRDPSLQFVNMGVNGLTTGGLAAMLRTPQVQRLVAWAGIITISIGSNDLLHEVKALLNKRAANVTAALGTMAINLKLIGQLIRANNPQAVVKIALIYNPLPGSPYQMFASQAQGIIAQANRLIETTAEEFNFVLVPIERTFRGREPLLLGPDHLHPNAAGHAAMAELFI